MSSITVDKINSQKKLYLREFSCFDCGYYSLTDIQKGTMLCPNCDALLEPSEDFIIKSIESIDQKRTFPDRKKMDNKIKSPSQEDNFGSNANKLKEYYYEVYKYKFKEVPIMNYVKVMSVLKKMFENKDITLEMCMACVPIFLELPDDFRQVRTKCYPLEYLQYYLPQCREEVKRHFQYFNGTEEEYYKKHIANFIIKSGIKLNEGGTQSNRRKNKKHPGDK